MIGATTRWAVGAALEGSTDIGDGGFPWHTLAVNVVGCLAIGICAVRLPRDGVAWSFAVTGLLGGFTTMSALAWETNELVDNGRSSTAAIYLAVTLGAGMAAVVVGQQLGRRASASVPARPTQ
jgi:CrcB protein